MNYLNFIKNSPFVIKPFSSAFIGIFWYAFLFISLKIIVLLKDYIQ
jgi:hypothetical protein